MRFSFAEKMLASQQGVRSCKRQENELFSLLDHFCEYKIAHFCKQCKYFFTQMFININSMRNAVLVSFPDGGEKGREGRSEATKKRLSRSLFVTSILVCIVRSLPAVTVRGSSFRLPPAAVP